jgi:uncharacterized protein
MKHYQVKVKPNKKRDTVYWQQKDLFGLNEEVLIVETKEPPLEGRANKRVIELVAMFLEVPKKNISIKSGLTSKNKILVVL